MITIQEFAWRNGYEEKWCSVAVEAVCVSDANETHRNSVYTEQQQ